MCTAQAVLDGLDEAVGYGYVHAYDGGSFTDGHYKILAGQLVLHRVDTLHLQQYVQHPLELRPLGEDVGQCQDL